MVNVLFLMQYGKNMLQILMINLLIIHHQVV